MSVEAPRYRRVTQLVIRKEVIAISSTATTREPKGRLNRKGFYLYRCTSGALTTQTHKGIDCVHPRGLRQSTHLSTDATTR